MSVENWEERYQTGDMPWEKGEASPGLVDFLANQPGLTRGTVCVPGCGTGHDARAWAAAGFEVHGFDIAPSAIRLATEKTRAAELKADFRLGNFCRMSHHFSLIGCSSTPCSAPSSRTSVSHTFRRSSDG